MASKRKVNLDDYQLTTTLGTGKFKINHKCFKSQLNDSCENDGAINAKRFFTKSNLMLMSYRILWSCAAGQK